MRILTAVAPKNTYSRKGENLPKAIEEVKSEIIFSYVRGEISEEELRAVFGDDAEDIEFVAKKTKK